MLTLKYPKYNSQEVKKASDYLFSLTRSDSRLQTFFRGYFANSLTRIAMNLVCLKQQIKPGDSLLDVGSFGIEPAIINIKKEFPACTVKALSYEGNRIGVGPEGFYETTEENDSACVHIDQIDIERQIFPYPDNFFDIVTCFEVLEHLKFSPIHMMKEIKRVLKPDGKFLLTTPNINSAGSIARILSGESPQECPFFHNSLEYGVAHPKEYTIEEVQDLYSSLGFHIETIDTINTSPLKRVERFITLLRPLLSLLKKICSNKSVFNLKLGKNIIVIAQKGGPIITETPVRIIEQ